MAVSGQRLFKILYSISKKYDVDFEFCTKAETGQKIIELLGGDADGNLAHKRKTDYTDCNEILRQICKLNINGNTIQR